MAGKFKITLCAIEKKDLKLLQYWRNSDAVMPYCRQYRPLSMANMEKWFDKLSQDKDYNLTNDLFVIEMDGEAVGVGGLVRIDWRNRKGEMSFYLASAKACVEEVIIEALLVFLGHAFKTLGLFKVYFPVYSFNPYLSVYEKVMKREYVARKEYFWEGKFWDRVILVSYAEENL